MDFAGRIIAKEGETEMRYDLSLMDVDGRRLKRRKKWLLFSLLPIIMVCCVALKLAAPGISTHFLKSAYNSGDYSTAKFWVQISLFANILEPYIAHFNDGTISYMQGEYAAAEGKLDLALRQNPPENRRCEVRVNLSLSIEAQADQQVESKSYDDAIVTYDRAKAVLYGDYCADPVDDSGRSPQAFESRDRIEEKQAEAVRSRNNDQPTGEDDNSNGAQNPDDLPVTQSQRQELQDLLKEAFELRRDNQSRAHGRDSTNDYTDSSQKNW